MPSARRIVAENRHRPGLVAGTGKDGRVTKGDMLGALEARAPQRAEPVAAARRRRGPRAVPRRHAAREERVPMTRLRKTIALRLKESQNTAAKLTTFNEVDMSRGDGAAQRVQGRLREEARRAAGLHGLLRPRPASRR